MVRHYFWLIAFTLMGACFSPSFKEGEIQCGPNDACPPGLDCHAGLCYSNPPTPIDAAPIDVPDAFALTVTKTGNGVGTITSAPTGINCPTDCNETFMAGTSVTLTATPSAGSTFLGWSGGGCTGAGACTVTVDAAKTVTASFGLGTLGVTLAGNGTGSVTSNPSGINCTGDCSENFTSGTVVTLTATPATGSTFTGWAGGSCAGTGPTCTVTIGAAVTITATFTLEQFALTVVPGGNGSGTVTSSPAGISCVGDCSENYNYGTTVTLTATATGGSVFGGWTGGTCSTASTCVVNITAVTNVTATFNLIQDGLTVTVAGNGTVTSNPSGIMCPGDCTEPYVTGTAVVLTAAPGTGSVFSGWTGGGCTVGSTAPCTVTLSGATAVTATFTLTTHPLTVTLAGPTGGGTVTSSPGTINCPAASCSQSFNFGTVVTLTATPALGHTFTGWTNGCSGTATTCQVTTNMMIGVTATFAISTPQLEVTLAGTGAGNTGGAGTGAVTSVPAGISCGSTCRANFNFNTMVTLTQTVGTGTTFTGWSGACSGMGSTCVVTMDQVRFVTATFALQPVMLSVTKAGTGSGGVTSVPAGINCGTTCTNTFDYATSVTLTATPAYGSTFTGWSDACSGSSSTCVVTLTAARNATATFAAVPPNRVFVTSTSHTGNLGGLAGADAICATRATAVGFGGTFRAWLSTPTVNARDRLGTATGWIRSDGQPVFNSLADLLAGKHIYPIAKDELGNLIAPNTPVMTATQTNGVYDDSGGSWGNCSNWTSAAASTVFIGYADVNSQKWTNYAGGNCSNTAMRFYCFQVDNQAVVQPADVPARTAFTTNATWSPSGGLASADALCASEATAAGLQGVFRALLASTANSAIGRFNTTTADRPWANRNGTLLAPTAGALAVTAPPFANFDAPPNLNAAGTSFVGGSFHWTGAPDLVSIGTVANTCSNWSSNTSAATGRMGVVGHASIAEAWNWGNQAWACNSVRHLVCLQN
ncbi:MAG: hypothetical protein H0T42_13315 [Deltaproteobacteria bacterium]|nr:hypothetical protein [Deltaproteobacteria bacterium]